MKKIDGILVYRCFLMGIMLVMIGFGVWYITNSSNEQRSIKDGTLVLQEVGTYAANCVH